MKQRSPAWHSSAAFVLKRMRRGMGLSDRPDVCRFFQMMWRLNFLVVFTCIVMRNDYMLYYICPMHTIFTVAALPSRPTHIAARMAVGWGMGESMQTGVGEIVRR